MICGLKTTHDGAVALIDGNRLLFSTEAEKLGNRPRYSRLEGLSAVRDQLAHCGVTPTDLKALVLDGWYGAGSPGARAIRDEAGAEVALELAGYSDLVDDRFVADPFNRVGGSLPFGGIAVEYRSYPHTIDHLFSAYCTSPFALGAEAALILVWDGGTPAVLYLFQPSSRALTNLGIVLDTSGFIYPVFASSLAPFRSHWLQGMEVTDGAGEPDAEAMWWWSLSVPGKAMAYAGLGQVEESAIEAMARLSPGGIGRPGPVVWTTRCQRELAPLGLPDASLMASFQEFLYRELEKGLAGHDVVRSRRLPLCFVGGCALNIKFNSRLRASGLFTDVWVPPFPNDSGSALGAACVEMVRATGHVSLEWSVFAGPDLGAGVGCPPGWSDRACSVEDLAGLLADEGEPVVVLDGRAELGPRALGHRSIIAPAHDGAMKDRLNHMKGREHYRPVAPICLESASRQVFQPGGRDPYMLFDHTVRPEWQSRIPAVIHVDGTARLQTVGEDNALMHRLLVAYERLSGIPVLCNTSANYSGCGFFPDAASAMAWGQAPYVWASGRLYHRSPVETA